MAKRTNSRVVYSTQHGRLCPQCQRAILSCVCGADRPASVGDGIIRIRRETKGRAAKQSPSSTGPGICRRTEGAVQATQAAVWCGRIGQSRADRNSGRSANTLSAASREHGLQGQAVRRIDRPSSAVFFVRSFEPRTVRPLRPSSRHARRFWTSNDSRMSYRSRPSPAPAFWPHAPSPRAS